MNAIRTQMELALEAKAALEALGNTVDAVIENLRKRGIKGSRNSGKVSHTCIISRYLNAELGVEVATAFGHYCHTADLLFVRPDGPNFKNANASAIATVQRKFDSGELPKEFYDDLGAAA